MYVWKMSVRCLKEKKNNFVFIGKFGQCTVSSLSSLSRSAYVRCHYNLLVANLSLVCSRWKSFIWEKELFFLSFHINICFYLISSGPYRLLQCVSLFRQDISPWSEVWLPSSSQGFFFKASAIYAYFVRQMNALVSEILSLHIQRWIQSIVLSQLAPVIQICVIDTYLYVKCMCVR